MLFGYKLHQKSIKERNYYVFNYSNFSSSSLTSFKFSSSILPAP